MTNYQPWVYPGHWSMDEHNAALAELQCGISIGGGADHCVEQSEDTGAWYGVTQFSNGDVWREPIADIGAATEKRVAAVCEAIGAHYYIQGDPRGAALWVDSKPIPDNDHTGAVCCAVY